MAGRGGQSPAADTPRTRDARIGTEAPALLKHVRACYNGPGHPTTEVRTPLSVCGVRGVGFTGFPIAVHIRSDSSTP